MEVKRKPFQGVLNIIRFNWHVYLLAFAGIVIGLFAANHTSGPIHLIANVGLSSLGIIIFLSLCISFLIYDTSDLYELPFLKTLPKEKEITVLNFHAGFDETSDLIQHKFPLAKITIADFYNPEKHTEISIKRARKIYPPGRETISVSTTELPFPDKSFQHTCIIFSAHETRNPDERLAFLKEVRRVTTEKVFITEHLRDTPNFLAYTIGFLHFHSKASWLSLFEKSGFMVDQQIKTTPFITTFVLHSHGNPS